METAGAQSRHRFGGAGHLCVEADRAYDERS